MLFFFVFICKKTEFWRYRYMIVLKPIKEKQKLGVIPREILDVADVYLTLTDNTTGELFEPTGDDLTVQYIGDYLHCTIILSPTIKESRFYTLIIGSIEQRDLIDDQSYIVYKDLVFCTNQDTTQLDEKTYDINKKVYKEQETSNNDYIVLWAERNMHKERLMLLI